MQAPARSRPGAPARALARAARAPAAPSSCPSPLTSAAQPSRAARGLGPRRPLRPRLLGCPPRRRRFPSRGSPPGAGGGRAGARRCPGRRAPAGGLRVRAKCSGRRASALGRMCRRRRPRPPSPGGQSLGRPPGKRGGRAASSSPLSTPWLPATRRRSGGGAEECLLDRRVDGLRAGARLESGDAS